MGKLVIQKSVKYCLRNPTLLNKIVFKCNYGKFRTKNKVIKHNSININTKLNSAENISQQFQSQNTEYNIVRMPFIGSAPIYRERDEQKRY